MLSFETIPMTVISQWGTFRYEFSDPQALGTTCAEGPFEREAMHSTDSMEVEQTH